MKMRNKGKIHPFTSSSSSSSTQTNNNDVVFPVLNLLPTSIFTLISLLSIQEREVLAYMVSRSLKNPLTCNTNKKNKKLSNQTHDHKSPALFDCDCFHCYTSFWFRWDSSPNRELIHQAIEAFEEHLNSDESSRNRKNKKMGRRKNVVLEEKIELPEKVDFPVAEEVVETADEVVAPVVVVEGHRGLARKVLPDVMGIFNSRLWRLWSPNA